jgi:hypothetical protein
MSWKIEIALENKNRDSKYSIIKIQNKEESKYLTDFMKQDEYFDFVKESKLWVYLRIKGNCTDCQTYYNYAKHKSEYLELEEKIKLIRGEN